MSQPGDDARERGGSFCAPDQGRSGSGSNSNSSLTGTGKSKTDEQKALENVSRHDPIRHHHTSEQESEFACSTIRATNLSFQSRTNTFAAPVDMLSHESISRSSTPYRSPVTQPEPPVTKSTLAELDVPRIVLNPKLRHDVNFDPDLHFRPNLDGEKGKKKMMRANRFWEVLKAQLQTFMSDPVGFTEASAGREWCLPATLRAIGEILETLVPPEDRASVADIMNVDLLMQQFAKQVADLESLASWLAKTLKMHCAPMRDEWVNEMVVQLSKGNQQRDINLLTQGLQTLMGVLEAMKLDVANHQIRCLRPLLIQDTVDFEQVFFMKKIATKKIDITYAHQWYRQCSDLLSDSMPLQLGTAPELWSFFQGFVKCLLPSHANERVPDTFMFDEERLLKLRGEVYDAVHVEICIRLFRKVYADAKAILRKEQVVGAQRPTEERKGLSAMSSNDFNARVQANSLAKEKGQFRRSVFPDIQVFEPYPSPASSSTSTTPFSSPCPSPPPPSNAVSPTSRITTAHEASGGLLPTALEETTLISDMRAILADVMSTMPSTTPSNSLHNRWSVATPNIALRILNATSHPINSYSRLLPHLEQTIASAVSITTSHLFLEAEASILSAMSPVLSHVVAHFITINNSRLFEAAVLPRGRPLLERLFKQGITHAKNEEGRRVVARDEVKEITRGIAHVGVLHWRVWSPLAYLVNPDKAAETPSAASEDEMVVDEVMPSAETPDANSSSAAVEVRPRQTTERDDIERALREKKRRSFRRRSGQGRFGGRTPPRSP